MKIQKGENQKKSARDLKSLCILSENSAFLQHDLPLQVHAGVTYLSMRIHLKSYRTSPKKVAATLCSGSRKGAVEA